MKSLKAWYKQWTEEYIVGKILMCLPLTIKIYERLKALYWLSDCEMSKDKYMALINDENALNDLLKNEVITLDKNDNIVIDWLLEQEIENRSKSYSASINGKKGGRPKKTEVKAKQKPIESETKAIREEDIRKDEIKIDNNAYNFLKSNSPQEIEAFEMQNKKSFDNYNVFVDYFNNKVNFEEIEFTVNKLMSRLKMLNSNWDKTNKNNQNNKPNKPTF